MGRYLKTIESTVVTNDESINVEERKLINRCKDRPNHGPTIFSLKNPETNVIRNVFVNNYNVKWETDNITEFTWRFDYKLGYPCVYITFTNIHDQLYDNEAILCLETNTHTSQENQSIGVFEGGAHQPGDFPKPLEKNRNFTWISFEDIEPGIEYCLFIQNTPRTGIWHSTKFMFRYEIPSDWLLTLNIRPSIRINSLPYTNYKALSEYREISYLYWDGYTEDTDLGTSY